MASWDQDWAWHLKDHLDIILENLAKFSDYVRFSAVCKQWRYVALNDNNYPDCHGHRKRLRILKACHNQLPMLMIQTKENNKEKRGLFSVTEGITYEVQLPLPCENRFFGSSHGWLLTIEKTMIITLLNPFANGAVSLPVFKDPSGEFEYWVDDVHDYFTVKGILSSDPYLSPNNYEVVVIYGGMAKLAFYRSCSDSWNFINMKRDYVFSDVIYYKGQVHAVNCWSELVQIGVASGNDRIMTKISTVCAQATYLVESQDGDLLLVQRFCKDNANMHPKTSEFKVFKLLNRMEQEWATWVQIKNMGDQALFLGDNHSVSVSTLEFPSCRPNSIYYIDQKHVIVPPYDCHGLDADSGVFNLEEGSFQSHYMPDPYQKHKLPPVWSKWLAPIIAGVQDLGFKHWQPLPLPLTKQALTYQEIKIKMIGYANMPHS